MAISYLMLSAFRIYILERVEEIDVVTKFEHVKSNSYFRPKIIFCIPVFTIKCKDWKKES